MLGEIIAGIILMGLFWYFFLTKEGLSTVVAIVGGFAIALLSGAVYVKTDSVILGALTIPAVFFMINLLGSIFTTPPD